MSAVLGSDVLDDDVAVALARVMAIANRRARELGVDATSSMISITQIDRGRPLWRVSYGPKDYVGQRGGDLIVEVDGAGEVVDRVLRGQ